MGFERPTHDDIDLTTPGRPPAKEKGKRKGPVGRTDRSGQEAVIELGRVKENIQTLVDLYKLHEESGKDLNEGIKATAEKSGLLASTIRKFVVARAGERFAEKAREVEQLALVFEEVGEKAGLL